jgi:acetyl esterase/lipase
MKTKLSLYKSLRPFAYLLLFVFTINSIYAQKTIPSIDSIKTVLKGITPSSYFPNSYVDSVMLAQSTSSFTGTNGTPPPSCCNNICITGTYSVNAPGGWCGTNIPNTTYSYTPGMTDPYGNAIWYTGKYGTDDRQKYYVYYPVNKTATSPIVVLIHGGAWFTGPNPSTVNGFPTKWDTKTSTNSMVKQLLDQGYVVVSVLYRLAKYANPTENVLDNDVTLQMQIDDIGSAITHINTNFPICLNLNANSIQVLGESAGAHLALMYSYTQASTSYVKSVISMYAPTDMNKYANNLKNKYCFGTSNVCNFTCGTTFFQNTNLKYVPCYFFTDINNIFTTIGNLSSLNYCGISAADQNYINTTGCFFIPSLCNSNMKIIDTYRLLESILRKSIPTANVLTDADLLLMSPYNRLVSTRIIPTFIMHGTGDNIVPYNWLGNNMQNSLSNPTLGGLINGSVYNNTAIPTSATYATTTQKHLIKTYTNAPHGWDEASFPAIRTDVITWLNGHK